MDRAKLATTAIRAAERLRAKAQLTSISIADPIEMAIDTCKCKVIFQSLPSLEGMYSPEPSPIIILGSQRPQGRQMYTCAHELAHHIFGHGTSMDELGNKRTNTDPKELLADMFAGYLLMPKIAVVRALRDRGIVPSNISPEQIYKLSNYFNVGYSSVVTHLRFSLNLIQDRLASELLRIQPKQIKESYGVPADATAYFIDHFWMNRAATISVGDVLFVPMDCTFELGIQLELIGECKSMLACKAISPGYARLINNRAGWAVNIRISRKKYEGLARYRFLEEADDSL